MNVNNNDNNYTYETFINTLKESVDKKEIDGKEFKNGKLSTSWVGWLKAKVQNGYYRITNQKDKIASLENAKVRNIFNTATSYFLEHSEKSLVIYQYNHNTSVNALKTKIFVNTHFSYEEKIKSVKDFISLLNTFESKLNDQAESIKQKNSELNKLNLKLNTTTNDKEKLESEIEILDFEIRSLTTSFESYKKELNTIVTEDSYAILPNLQIFRTYFSQVQIKEGIPPILTEAHSTTAVDLISTILGDTNIPEHTGRIFLTKMIQYLLVGDLNKSLPLEEDSFTIEGVNDLKNEQSFEVNPFKFTIDLQASSNLENLKKKEKDPLNTLFTKFNPEKDVLVETIPSEVSEDAFNDLVVKNFNPKSNTIIKEIQKLVNSDKERSDLIKGLLTLRLESAKKLVQQTFTDMHRGGFATLKVNGRVYESNFEGQKECFAALRQQFIKHIKENDIEDITKKNEELSKLTGIPSSIDDNLFSSFIGSSTVTEGKKRIEMISEVSHINKTDLPPGTNVKLANDAWKFYLLHVFLFTNQATAGINGNTFDNSKDLTLTFQNEIFVKPYEGKLTFTGEFKPNRVGAPEIELSPTSLSYTLRESLVVDNVENDSDFSLFPEMQLLPSRYDEKNKMKKYKEFTNLPILTSSRTIKIDNFYYNNKKNEEKPTFIFFSDIKLGMTAFPLIGKIKEALSKKG